MERVQGFSRLQVWHLRGDNGYIALYIVYDTVDRTMYIYLPDDTQCAEFTV